MNKRDKTKVVIEPSLRVRVSHEYVVITKSGEQLHRIIRELLQRPSLGAVGAGVGEGGKVYGYRVDLTPDSGRIEPQ